MNLKEERKSFEVWIQKVIYTENVNVVAGDAVQVYAKVSANISAYIQNFRLTTDYSDTASARVIT